MRWLIAIVVGLVVWSILAFMFIYVFAGAHVCAIFQPVGEAIASGSSPTLVPLTQAEMAAQVARCSRPDVGAILVFGLGYVVFAVAIWSRWAERNDAPPTGSTSD
jgi:hypothetical protein